MSLMLYIKIHEKIMRAAYIQNAIIPKLLCISGSSFDRVILMPIFMLCENFNIVSLNTFEK